MGKKGRRCKTRWRRLPMGGERNGEEAEEDECCDEGGGDCPGRCTASAALGGRERARGGGSDGAASPQQNGAPRPAASNATNHQHHHAPYKGGARAGGRGSFSGRRGGGPVTDGVKKPPAGGSGVYTFNEEEYTKITTPRQDVLFKKGYLMARKKDAPVTVTTSTASTNGSTPNSVEATNGEANGTSGNTNGDASSSSDQTYSAQVSGSGAEDENGGCNGYTYVNGYANGYSYGGPYHMDQSGAMPNGGAYFVNGGSYELYDPYAAMAAAAGYAFPYVGAPPPHQPPPHTLPPLQTIDWYASRPHGSTGDVQWCQLVASPAYSETRRKRYSTDSQNCSPPSSESTGPPGSPQEEAVSSSGGGDPCHAHQPMPQYHHAHVFQGPHPAAAYVYPGYLFGPAVYSVNGVPLAAATPLHPLHGISQSIHVHPSAAVAAAGPVSGAQGGAPAAAPGSDGGSQRRRKKKRRRKRKRGLTDDASEETSSEVGEEEGTGGGGSVSCGACNAGAGAREDEFEEDEEEEDEEEQVGPVVVVRLGNVVPLVMSQQPPPQGPPPMVAPQQYVPQEATQGSAGGKVQEEASSTDCSELSGHPESSSSTSGGEETVVPEGDQEDRPVRSLCDVDHGQRQESPLVEFGERVGEDFTRGDLVQVEEERTAAQDVSSAVAEADTIETWIQSPPEVAVQVGGKEPATPPPSPTSITPQEGDAFAAEAQSLAESGARLGTAEKPIAAAENGKSIADEKPQPAQRPGRRRNGRGRNNKASVAVIQSEEPPVDEPKPTTPPAVDLHRDEVEVLHIEEPEPVQFIPETPKVEHLSPEPAQEPIEGPKSDPPVAMVESSPAVEEIVVAEAAHTPVQQVAPVSAHSAPEKMEEREKAVKEPKRVEASLKEANETSPQVEGKMPLPQPEPINTRHLPVAEKQLAVEPECKPEVSFDAFTFKPEPYKHPMLKTTMKETKDDPSLITELLTRDRNGVAAENQEEKAEAKLSESTPPSRHLDDLPRKKTRLKKPPEREQTPGALIEDVTVVEERVEDVPEVVSSPITLEKETSSTLTRMPDNNNVGEKDQEPVSQEHQTILPELEAVLPEQRPVPQEPEAVSELPEPRPVSAESQPVPVQSSADEETISKEETLTEVVSKWLEENSDALPESLEEIKGGELKTEAVPAVGAEGEEISTGSKNGVRNPFPAPSNRLPKHVCARECVSECVRACESNESECAFSGDGPSKRVANRIFGAGEEVAKTEVETKLRRENQEGVAGRKGAGEVGVEGGTFAEEDDDQGSCEWEPMTVETPRRKFADLESWKRVRGGLGGSTEALKSLGSYRGTDDEEEEEARKARLNMCDPTSSVAKYYCLGAARETKSPSPEDVPAKSAAPAPTDSGVQTDEEEDIFSVTTAEEAKEEPLPTGHRKPRLHKPVGLGKTAAFVARQIGATESAKGPFPCGICCIIQ